MAILLVFALQKPNTNNYTVFKIISLTNLILFIMPNSIFLDKIEVDDQLTKANAIKAETAAADDDDFDDDDYAKDLVGSDDDDDDPE